MAVKIISPELHSMVTQEILGTFSQRASLPGAGGVAASCRRTLQFHVVLFALLFAATCTAKALLLAKVGGEAHACTGRSDAQCVHKLTFAHVFAISTEPVKRCRS